MTGSALLFGKICIYDYMQRTKYELREPKQYNTNPVKVFEYYDFVKEFWNDKISNNNNNTIALLNSSTKYSHLVTIAARCI